MAYEAELDSALIAAEKAGAAILSLYREFVAIADAPISISTEADRTAQEIILQELLRRYPDDAYCAEEATPTLAEAKRSGERLWIVDPIDGTRGFARKNGEFSVMVGLIEGGQPVVGVVLEPANQRTTYARQGGGCFVREGESAPAACQVSTTADLSQALLTQSHTRGAPAAGSPVARLRPRAVTETYSAGIKLALVARGVADLYVNTYDAFHDWDICAGHLLVTEAGGRVTGLAGQTIVYAKPEFWQKDGLLATNGLLHDAAVRGLS